MGSQLEPARIEKSRRKLARAIINRLREVGGDIYLSFEKQIVIDIPDGLDTPEALACLEEYRREIQEEIVDETPTIEWLEQVREQRGPNWGKWPMVGSMCQRFRHPRRWRLGPGRPWVCGTCHPRDEERDGELGLQVEWEDAPWMVDGGQTS